MRNQCPAPQRILTCSTGPSVPSSVARHSTMLGPSHSGQQTNPATGVAVERSAACCGRGLRLDGHGDASLLGSVFWLFSWRRARRARVGRRALAWRVLRRCRSDRQGRGRTRGPEVAEVFVELHRGRHERGGVEGEDRRAGGPSQPFALGDQGRAPRAESAHRGERPARGHRPSPWANRRPAPTHRCRRRPIQPPARRPPRSGACRAGRGGRGRAGPRGTRRRRPWAALPQLPVRGPQHRADARVVAGRCGAHGDAEQGVDFHAFSLRSQVPCPHRQPIPRRPANCRFLALPPYVDRSVSRSPESGVSSQMVEIALWATNWEGCVSRTPAWVAVCSGRGCGFRPTRLGCGRRTTLRALPGVADPALVDSRR